MAKRKAKKRRQYHLPIASFGMALLLTTIACMIGFPDFPLNRALGLAPATAWLQAAVGPILRISARVGEALTGQWDTALHFYVSLGSMFVLLWLLSAALIFAALALTQRK